MYQYTATIDRVIDGDTVEMTVDCGFRLSFRDRFRLAHIDAPEHNAASRNYLVSLLTPGDGRRWQIETSKPDKYGRWLVVIHHSSTTVNAQMVVAGFAVPYEGGTKG